MSDKYQALRDAIPLATPGEWKAGDSNAGSGLLPCWFVSNDEFSNPTGGESPSLYAEVENGDDAAYIAAANPATIGQLLAERDALLKDAERYKWLANRVLVCDYGDNDTGDQVGWRIQSKLCHGSEFGRQSPIMYGPSIDAAIDAAKGKS